VKRLLLIAAGACALALAPAASAGGPHMFVGAADDIVLQNDPAAAKSEVDLAKLAGLDTIRVTAQWARADRTLSPGSGVALENAVAAANLAGVRVILSLYPFGSSVTPLTDADRADFVAWTTSIAEKFPTVRDFIVGNEPNLNRFWLPQYDDSGADAAAPAYLQLLAQTYDAIKVVRPHSTVYGGALAPRGSDRPEGIRPTHSPTAFIQDLGAAYRASGRAVPVMDAFAFHPYADNSSIPPSFEHPKSTSIGIADYDKLVGLLGTAFDGTAQRGSTLPILYDEFGVEAQIPDAKASLYDGDEPATIHPVDEATQAEFYRQALELTFCQPNVIGLLLFHFADEKQRAAWQSGLYYVDGTPKSSLPAVRDAADETRRGVVAECGGLALRPKLTLKLGKPIEGRMTVTVTSTLDARVSVALERVGATGAAKPFKGTVVGRTPKVLRYRLHPGRYRWTLTATAVVNAGAPATLTSRTIRIR
jgi:hypothetical protein